MTDATDPRPRFSDRIRAAYRAFRDPDGAFLAGMRTEARLRAAANRRSPAAITRIASERAAAR